MEGFLSPCTGQHAVYRSLPVRRTFSSLSKICSSTTSLPICIFPACEPGHTFPDLSHSEGTGFSPFVHPSRDTPHFQWLCVLLHSVIPQAISPSLLRDSAPRPSRPSGSSALRCLCSF